MEVLSIAQINRKVLVYEDENRMQEALSEALIPKKVQLKFASKDAIGQSDFEPGLILLDQASAPFIGKGNLCEKIKSFFPTTPLIVLSAYPLTSFGKYHRHMDGFIEKPFDLNYFLKCVERYLITTED